jgi:hypothetical protein
VPVVRRGGADCLFKWPQLGLSKVRASGHRRRAESFNIGSGAGKAWASRQTKCRSQQRRSLMACGNRTSDTASLDANLSDLDEMGRLQFFYHSPRSMFPVRDILNDQHQGYKTEPHIEKGAENYCQECIQRNIRKLLEGTEKYLFLFTRCKNENSGHFGKLYVVGYILKHDYELRPGGFYAVLGETKLYSFDDAYPLASDRNPRHFRKKCDRHMTLRILDHFDRRRNIINRCLKEVKRLKRILPDKVRKRQARQCR